MANANSKAKRGNQKLQSAMEYLVTYGWSILILGVVLVTVVSLGVLSPSAQSASKTCISQSGFVCGNPVLNSSGILNITFGQSSGTSYNITGVACTNSTIPTSFISIKGVNLKSGQTTHLNFLCPLTSKAVGTPATGTLWVTYSTPAGVGYEVKLGTFSVKVSTSSTVGGFSPAFLHSVPITLSNAQSSPTGLNFQEMLTINSIAYSHYINSGWGNVEFSTGNGTAGNTGTILNAWVESGASNSSSSTVVWVNLPGGIGASSNTVIYMNMLPSNVMSISGPTGEAPQLSSSYGKYDDGAQVFNFYDNFSGTSLNPQWSTANTNYAIVNNGITIQPNGYNALGFGIWTTTYTQSAGVVDMYGTIPSGAYEGGYDTVVAGVSDTKLMNVVGIGEYDGSANVYGLLVGTPPWGLTSSEPPSPKASGLTFGTPGIYSLLIPSASPSSISAQYNYAGTISVSSGLPTFPLPIAVVNEGSSAITLTFTWIRARAYPPNGVMPAATYGS